VVAAPVTVEVKVFVFAVPEDIVQDVGEIVTTGGGVIVTRGTGGQVHIFEGRGGDGDGWQAKVHLSERCRGRWRRWFLPYHCPLGCYSLFQMMIELVPPEVNPRN